MRRWWQLGMRNWSADRGPAIASVIAVALGVAIVVAITTFYESALVLVRRDLVVRWLGQAHLSVAPPGAHWGQLQASFADELAGLDNVAHVTARLMRRVVAIPAGGVTDPEHRLQWVELIGIDPATVGPFLTVPNLEGRMLQPGDHDAIVLEKQLADELRVALGGTVDLASYDTAPPTTFTIVGVFDSRRLADFQQPIAYASITDVQTLKNQPGVATLIDVQLHDASQPAIRRAEAAARELLSAKGLPYEVSTAATRLGQLEEAERITRLMVVMAAAVALLAAFFIMLTTMSAALYRQGRTLGVMRCIGFTRAQLAGLVAVQITPPTMLGAALGVPLGWTLVKLGLWFAGNIKFEGQSTEAFDQPLSRWGLLIAFISVGIVWVLCLSLLMVQVCAVTPLRAALPEAKPTRKKYLVLACGAGLALIGVHEYLLHGGMNPAYWLRADGLFVGLMTLGFGFVLIAPMVVWLLGSACASIAGPLTMLRPALARDQFGKAPWLSAGVCWVLMAGLSLIVYTAVRAEGVLVFWDFPSRLPEAFVWTHDHVTYEAVERASRIPGVGKISVTSDVDCKLEPVRADASKENSLLTALFEKLTRPVFVAGDVDTFLQLAKLGFAESDTEEVRAKLHAGGYVLVPPQTSRSKGLRKGDRVRVTIGALSHEFEVADVVESPALDLAVNFFGAENYMQFAAASAVLGTREDLVRFFKIDRVAMMMCNLEISEAPAPPFFSAAKEPDQPTLEEAGRRLLEWLPIMPEAQATFGEFEPAVRDWLEGRTPLPPMGAEAFLEHCRRALGYVERRWENRTPQDRWDGFRERLVLLHIAYAIDRPDAIVGSITRMREMLQRDVRRGVRLVTWAPSFALVIASLGIGNLMMVRVAMRAKAIAMLRAIGMTRGQTLRLVLAEAVTLGLLGSIMGLALGFYSARSANLISSNMAGLTVPWVIPWDTIALAVGVTVAVCLLAGLKPARRAARDNVLAALGVE